MEKLLRLGRVDEDVKFNQADKAAFLDLYHHPEGFRNGRTRFRDDIRRRWLYWENLEGNRVRELTRFLQAAGFMPNASHDGIFGYVTLAAVRLFQEYCRSVAYPELHARGEPPSWPDGIVGQDTRFYMNKWTADNRECRWSLNEQSPDHVRWISWLRAAREHYVANPSTVMRHLVEADERGDSLVPSDWSYDADVPHLIGIRRNAHKTPDTNNRRPPDDLFVLLVNGISFYFSGSTDAKPNTGSKAEGFLMEGQHLYRFNWHKLELTEGEPRSIYKAARPAGAGVMVIRDKHRVDRLSEENRRDGFDSSPNDTFNIHWNGLGKSNWSAGCQVISGNSYFNDAGQLVDCEEYTAPANNLRGTKGTPSGPRRSMGAYTLLSDLLLCYTRQQEAGKKPTLRYSLFQEEAFNVIQGISLTEIRDKLGRMRYAS